MNSRDFLQISVDINEQHIEQLVWYKVTQVLQQEIEFAVRRTCAEAIGPHFRKLVADAVNSENMAHAMQKHFDEEVAKALSPDALTKVFMNKVFKSAVQSEAAKASQKAKVAA
jgi:hypothetical protein